MATGSQGQPWGCLIAVALVGLATWFSNPSLATHRRALRVELQQRGSRIGVDGVCYQNYGLASLTKYENQQLTFGIWGRVFVVAEDRSATPTLAAKQP